MTTGTRLRPFDRLFVEDRRPVARADAILRDGWQSRGLPALRLAPPLPWEGTLDASHAWGAAIHAWDPLAPLLAAYDTQGDPAYLRPTLDIALDWLAMHPAGSGIWRQLPAGRRAHRLAYLLDAAGRAGICTEGELIRLRDGLELHLVEIASAEQLATAPSSGIEQAAGQLSAAVRWPDLRGAERARELARARLATYLSERVANDGGPLEHSPGVLAGELALLSSLITAGLLEDRELRNIHDRAAEGLGWFIDPEGRLVAFGDTDADATPAVGEADGAGLRTFPDSGYAVVRVPRGTDPRRSSYLAQICAFHSTRHKHADELSIVWHDEGIALLADPGRYGLVGRNPADSDEARRGFRYSDPKRMFVESTGAHNTVEIDGRSDVRVRSRAYGSALRRTAVARDAFAIESSVRRAGVSHTRVVAFRPRRWTVVVDVLSDGRASHDLAQRFQLGPGIELEVERGRGVAQLAGRRLDVLPLLGAGDFSAVRGQESPRLLGWVSPGPMRLEPAWTVAVEARDVRRHVFATAFVLSESGAQPDPELIRANSSGRRIRLGWVADGRRHQIDLATDGDDLSFRHRAPVLEP